MIRKKLFRILALLVLLISAAPGWAQTSCSYTIRLYDDMYNRFYGTQVVVYNSLGTAVDTVYFRDDYQGDDHEYEYVFTAPAGTYYLGIHNTANFDDYYWDNRSIHVYDQDDIEVSSTYYSEK